MAEPLQALKLNEESNLISYFLFFQFLPTICRCYVGCISKLLWRIHTVNFFTMLSHLFLFNNPLCIWTVFKISSQINKKILLTMPFFLDSQICFGKTLWMLMNFFVLFIPLLWSKLNNEELHCFIGSKFARFSVYFLDIFEMWQVPRRGSPGTYLGSIERHGEVPVWGHEQVSASGYGTASL